MIPLRTFLSPLLIKNFFKPRFFSTSNFLFSTNKQKPIFNEIIIIPLAEPKILIDLKDPRFADKDPQFISIFFSLYELFFKAQESNKNLVHGAIWLGELNDRDLIKFNDYMADKTIKKAQKSDEILFLRFGLIKSFTYSADSFHALPGCLPNNYAPLWTSKLCSDMFNQITLFKKLGFSFNNTTSLSISLLVSSDSSLYSSLKLEDPSVGKTPLNSASSNTLKNSNLEDDSNLTAD